jgi:hypothetical protein
MRRLRYCKNDFCGEFCLGSFLDFGHKQNLRDEFEFDGCESNLKQIEQDEISLNNVF